MTAVLMVSEFRWSLAVIPILDMREIQSWVKFIRSWTGCPVGTMAFHWSLVTPRKSLPSKRLMAPPCFVFEVLDTSLGHNRGTPTVVVSAEQLPPLLAFRKYLFLQPLTTYPGGTMYYASTGCTYADGSHFHGSFLSYCCNAVLPHGWYRYDGQWGQAHVGSFPPPTPPASQLSYTVYSPVSLACASALEEVSGKSV